MDDEIAVQQCLTCKLANDDPERLTIVNKWLGEGKSYNWIIERAKDAWGIELNQRSLKRHYESGHLPDRYRITREAIEQALGKKYSRIHLNGVAALNLVVETWKDSLITKIARGEDIEIQHNVAIQAVKELAALTAKEATCVKMTYSDAAYVALVEAAMECIPPVKHLEFANYWRANLNPTLVEEMKQLPEYIEMLELRELEQKDDSESD